MDEEDGNDKSAKGMSGKEEEEKQGGGTDNDKGASDTSKKEEKEEEVEKGEREGKCGGKIW